MRHEEKCIITLEVLLKLQTFQPLTHRERNNLCAAAEIVLDDLRASFHSQDVDIVGAPRSKDEIPF